MDGKEKNRKTAAEAAYAYLSSRMRTVREVEKYLSERHYEEEEIQKTIDDLTGLRYLDDYQYALSFFEYNHGKRRGMLRAVRELESRGVDSETIRNAQEDFSYANEIDEFSEALEIAVKELENSGGAAAADEKRAASIARKLENRGFGRDTIFRVLDRIRSEA